MKMITIDKLQSLIKSAENIAIFGHSNPDMDCFGSMFGMSFVCSKLGKNATMFSSQSKEDFLCSLFPLEKVSNKEFKSSEFDLVILVDCNQSSRVEKRYGEEIAKHKNVLVIDHHELLEGRKEFKSYMVQENMCASSLQVSQIIQSLNLNLDSETATQLYTGIVGDTDRFLHTNTQLNTFEAAAFLVKNGADIQFVNTNVYRNTSFVQLGVYKHMLNNLHKNAKGVCFVIFSQKTLKKLGARVEDVKMYADALVKIKDFNVSILAYEQEKETYKLSFRSKDGYNVREVAKSYNGGGHICAAGAEIFGNAIKIKRQLQKISEEF